MRVQMMRFARLIDVHSGNAENHCNMVSLCEVFGALACINSAIRLSPNMFADVTRAHWNVRDIYALTSAAEVTSRVRGLCRPRNLN